MKLTLLQKILIRDEPMNTIIVLLPVACQEYQLRTFFVLRINEEEGHHHQAQQSFLHYILLWHSQQHNWIMVHVPRCGGFLIRSNSHSFIRHSPACRSSCWNDLGASGDQEVVPWPPLFGRFKGNKTACLISSQMKAIWQFVAVQGAQEEEGD